MNKIDETNFRRLFDHDTNVGPMRPKGLPRHVRHDKDTKRAATKTERVLYVIQRNLGSFTHQGLVATIEDLPEDTQRHTVRVQRKWVHIISFMNMIRLKP